METNIWDTEAAGRRLRAEREKRLMRQEDLAHAVGVTVVTQRNYESGRRQPTAEYLAHIEARGLDVLYILTGERLVGETLHEEEADLVFFYRRASPELQAAAKRLLGIPPESVPAADRGRRTSVKADSVGSVVQGDQHVKGPMTFNVGSKKKEKGK